MPVSNESWSCKIIDNQDPKDLTWTVNDPAVLQQLLEHCRNASPYEQTFTIDEREGYNGVTLFNNRETYTAFMGKLVHRVDDKTETKTDLGRKLEKLVLSNAPEPYWKKAMFILSIDFD